MSKEILAITVPQHFCALHGLRVESSLITPAPNFSTGLGNWDTLLIDAFSETLSIFVVHNWSKCQSVTDVYMSDWHAPCAMDYNELHVPCQIIYCIVPWLFTLLGNVIFQRICLPFFLFIITRILYLIQLSRMTRCFGSIFSVSISWSSLSIFCSSKLSICKHTLQSCWCCLLKTWNIVWALYPE